jgi:Bacterial membrane protein YfhO
LTARRADATVVPTFAMPTRWVGVVRHFSSALLPVGALLAPFVFLGWTVLSSQTVGNDYQHYPAHGPMSLRFYTGEGLEPMWYPHQTGGIPVGGLFYGQYFNLPAWITAQLPGFWNRDLFRWIALRHLLLLALAQGAYYVALRQGVGLGRGVSTLLSLVLVYNLRSLDAFRYAIALEAFVYMQVALLFGGLYVLRPYWPWLAIVTAATQLFSTSGYPVLTPFVAFAAVLSGPALLRVVGPHAFWRRGAAVTLAAAVGGLLAAPHWLALSEWTAVNHLRVAHSSLEWATQYALVLPDVARSLVVPWEADVHSTFGGATLLAAAFVAVVASLAVRRGYAMLGAFAFVFAYALGERLPVFPFFFAHVPGFATLRGPGRILYLLPILLFASLVWLRGKEEAPRIGRVLPITGFVLAGAALVALGRVLLGGGDLPAFSPASLNAEWTPALRGAWLTLAVVAGLALAGWALGLRRAGTVLAVVTVVQLLPLLRYGTWVAPRPVTATRAEVQAVNHLPLHAGYPLLATNELRRWSEATATVSYARFMRRTGDWANCYLPVHPDRSRGVVLPFYLSDRVECVTDTAAALGRLLIADDCLASGALRTIVAGPRCIPSAGAPGSLVPLNAGNRIRSLAPNVTTLAVDAPTDAVLVTALPDTTSNWKGYVDDRETPLLQVNGGFLGLRVPAGAHEVSIRYFSKRMLAGYRIAFVTAAVLAAAAVYLGTRRLRGSSGIAAVLALLAVVGSAAAYRSWEQGFVARAGRPAILNHDYPVLLRDQLARWQARP